MVDRVLSNGVQYVKNRRLKDTIPTLLTTLNPIHIPTVMLAGFIWHRMKSVTL